MAEYETPAKNASEIFERMTCLGMLIILQYQEVNWPRSTGAEKEELADGNIEKLVEVGILEVSERSMIRRGSR